MEGAPQRGVPAKQSQSSWHGSTSTPALGGSGRWALGKHPGAGMVWPNAMANVASEATNEPSTRLRNESHKSFIMQLRVLLITFLIACATAAQAISVTVNTTPTHCGLTNGKATASATGGVSPYAFLWNTGATTAVLNGIAPGTYSVTVTDANGDVANGSGVVQADPLLAQPYAFPESFDCDFTCTGSVSINEAALGGVAPYSYSLPSGGFWDGNHGPARFFEICANGTPLTITDANGCFLDMTLNAYGTFSWSPPILSVQPACGSQANGSISLGQLISEWSFQVVGANGFDSIYHFLGDPMVITGLPPGQYSVASAQPTGCSFPSDVTVPSLPEPCGSISGTVFNDVDGNCVQGGDDIGLPLRVMTLEPGPYYAFTDSAGQFEFSTVGYGNFTLGQPLSDESQLCPSSSPIAITINGVTPVVNFSIADSSHLSLDLEVLTQGTAMHPGFSWSRWITVRNNSAYPSGPATITFNYDPALDPVSYGTAGAAILNVVSNPPHGEGQ